MNIHNKLVFLIVYSVPLSMLVSYLLWRVYKYLLCKIPEEQWTPPDPRQNVVKHDWLLASALYTVLTLAYFLPSLSILTSALIGPPQDNMQNLWNFWWGYDVIVGRMGNFLYTNYICYPEGVSLLYHSYSWYNLFLSFVLRQIDGPVLAYNLLVLHTFVLSGLGAFLLIRYLVGNSYLALLGGYIYAFNPFHFAQSISHLNIASIQFIPFFVLYFIKVIKEGGRKDLFLTSLFFLLNTLCDWNYMIFAGYFMGFAYVYLAIRRKRYVLPDVIGKIVAIVGFTLVVLSYWLVRMVLIGLTNPKASAGGHNYYVADLLAFIIPYPYHLLSGLSVIKSVNETFSGNIWEGSAYMGIGNLLIIILFFKSMIRESARYFLALITFIVLAMGSTVHILGYSSPIMLPYKVIAYIPFLSNIRCPSRHIEYGYLFLAIIVPLTLKYLYRSNTLGKHRNYVIVGLIVLIVVDFYPIEIPVTRVYLPRCYEIIARESNQGAILDIPGGWVETDTYMMYQTIHERPIVQGTVSRKLKETLSDYLEHNELSRQKEQLVQHNVKYIVVHKSFMDSDESIDTTAYGQVYERIYSDQDQIVYRVF